MRLCPLSANINKAVYVRKQSCKKYILLISGLLVKFAEPRQKMM